MSPHVSDRLSEYMDGALGVQDVERVRAHLDTCPACLQEYRGLQDVQQLLRGLPAPHPREGFMERTHWRLARAAAAHPARARFLSGLREAFAVRPFRVALAAGALVVMVALPLVWMTGALGPREVPLDSDAYVRHYVMLSVDRPLADEATSTFVSSDLPEQPIR